jgi:hypothetical protein
MIFSTGEFTETCHYITGCAEIGNTDVSPVFVQVTVLNICTRIQGMQCSIKTLKLATILYKYGHFSSYNSL